MIEIRKTEMSDLPRLREIYAAAREYMREHGNPTQWADCNRPSEEEVVEDIETGTGYVLTDDGRVFAAFAFTVGPEPTYARIDDGSWIGDAQDYGTVHRLASDGSRSGVFERVFDFCRGRVEDLRIDTHEDNKTMRHLIEKQGFERRGIIYQPDGSPRIAYQLLKQRQK